MERLFLKGKRFLRDSGRGDDVYTHVKHGSRTHKFYLSLGFEEGETIMRGSI